MNLRLHFSITALLCYALLLSACSHLTPKADDYQSAKQLNQVQNWQAKGKLSVNSQETNATGYLTWVQNQQAYDILVSGPFGARSSRLTGDSQQASLLLAGWQQPQLADNAEQLMQQHLGWDFPVASLHYWIKGQIAPKGKAKPVFNEHGLLESLQQHGWNISFARYQQQQGVWLPGLIKMQGYNYRFTFAIAQWNLYDQ